MIEISIIVPVYNAEKYIARCISSIIEQTFRNFELILVDDGSVDQSGKICDIFASKDERIRVIHKQNGGVSSARNKGIETAEGKYIMFCDSDDYVEQNWCEGLYSLIIKPEVNLAFCGYQSVDVCTRKKIASQNYSSGAKSIIPRTLLWDVYMSNLLNMPWNKIYEANIIKKNNIIFDETWSYNEDLMFVLKYIQSSEGDFGISNELLYNYTQGIDGSLTKRYVSNLWDIKKCVFKELDSTIESCGIPFDFIKNEYYSKWIWAIESSIGNEMRKENKASVYEKFKNIFKITHSAVYKEAFKLGTFETTKSFFYKKVLKTRSSMLIMMYFYFNRLKYKIKD